MMSVTETAGKIMPLPRGEYVPSELYNILDIVSYNNSIYMARHSNIIGITPIEGDDWMSLYDNTVINMKANKPSIFTVTIDADSWVNNHCIIENDCLLDAYKIVVNPVMDSYEYIRNAKINRIEHDNNQLHLYASGEILGEMIIMIESWRG